MTDALVLAIDIGTSAVRSAAVDGGGVIVASTRVTRPDASAGTRFDAERLWLDVVQSIVSLPASARARISTLAIAGHVGTVFVDADGAPVGEGRGWADSSGIELLTAAAAIGQPVGLRATGAWALSQVEAKLRPASPWDTRLPARAAAMLLQQGWQQAARNEPNRLRASLPPRIEHAELRLALGGERSWLCHAPLLAAAVSAGRQHDAVDVAMLKLARAHDPQWFDRAFEWASAWLLADVERP